MTQFEETLFSKAQSPESVATYLGCSQRFVLDEIRAGRLLGRKLGHNLIRIMPSDLRAWLDRAAMQSAKRQEEVAA